MAAEHQYFYEDEVYRINKKGNIEFGMVLENSELVSSDENSDAEDNVKMKKGHIRVAWHPTGAEEVVSEKKVGLADRSLMPGDVVRRMIKGKDTQRGYCRHMEVTACVQVVGTRHIINNVKSKDLVPLEELAPDIAVCLDSWVGGIKVVHTKLHLRLPDNSKCIVTDPESIGFDIFDEKKDPDAEFPHRGDYYPGQILWGPLNVLDEIAEWVVCTKEIKGLRNRPSKIVKVMVEDVEIESVAVQWQCKAYSKDGAGVEKELPKVLITGKDLKRLKLLNVFEPCTLQVGDRNIYTLKPEDEVITKEQWRRQQRKLILNENSVPPRSKRKKRSQAAKLKDCEDGEETLEVENGHLDGLIPDETVDGEWHTETSESDTGSYASSSATSAISTGTVKRNPSLSVRPWTKVLHKKKLRRAPPKKPPPIQLNPGGKFVIETVSTMSSADVVWQDGSVELGIPSTELYPIHHLDDQEFFPGDFVIENREEACMRVYGVIQSVDHAGRTASVKWFKTYTATDNPQPSFLSEYEVSVYDLKDHPDFQYRPGTVVIRVANFQGEDETCSAGQVLDNYPEGRVRVWWVEGHVSMCWPQDLYKVGEYDSDEGELWDDGTSDDGSWQTESEDCTNDDGTADEGHDENLKPKLAANIEKARIAMSRLEEIFTKNPSLQTTDVMRKLLEVYKDCRYLDKLLGTSFFHESHFQGLLERVRERGRTNVAQRVADQVSRLFSDSANSNTDILASDQIEEKPNSKSVCALGDILSGSLASLEERVVTAAAKTPSSTILSAIQDTMGGVDQGGEKNGLPVSSGPIINPTSTPVNGGQENNTSDNNSQTCASQHVCVKLCSLILTQLVKAHTEVIRRFGNAGSGMSLSEAANNTSPTGSNSTQNSNPEPKTPSGVQNSATTVQEPLAPSKPVELQNGTIEEKEEIAPPPVPKQGEGFSILDTAPNSHKFKLTIFQPTDPKSFYRTVRNEIKLLRSSLPTGIWVKGFEDRMDLYSVMICGPEKSPYEDGLFFFDFQLPPDYPKSPPNCHYISYCSDRLNPNLYEDGKVCVSLLGTWSGKGTEVWTSTSNLLQVLVSIQGLILVSEPYFNEAGYEKQKGSQQGRENSRMYNEMVVLKLVQAMSKLISHPQAVFKEEIVLHFNQHAYKLSERLESWLDISEKYNNNHPLSPTTPTSYKQLIAAADGVALPEFPLIPASKGFCITLRKTLVSFLQVLNHKS